MTSLQCEDRLTSAAQACLLLLGVVTAAPAPPQRTSPPPTAPPPPPPPTTPQEHSLRSTRDYYDPSHTRTWTTTWTPMVCWDSRGTEWTFKTSNSI